MASVTEAALRQIQEFFSAEIAAALSDRQAQEAQWLRWLQSYKGQPQSKQKNQPWPNASNLVVGLTAIYTDSIVARILQSIFQIEPHWVVSPLNRTFAEHAKPLERYLDWLRTNQWDQFRAVKPMVLECVKLGTGILTTAWSDETFYRYDPRQEQAVPVGRRRGPRPAWVPREDFLLPPGFALVNDREDGPKAPWVAYRQWYALPMLRRLEFRRFIQDVDQILAHPTPETTLRQHRRHEGQGLPVPTTGTGPDAWPDASAQLWALWQIWFQWDLDGDGYPEEYVLLLHPESETVLRFRDNPYWRGLRPFVHASFVEQEGQFDGVGVAEMIEHYQAEVSTIHNQRRDNAHLANTVLLAARRGSGLTNQTKIYPGKILNVNEPTTDLRELRFGQNYLLTIQEEQVSIAMAERRVGMSDLNLGRESSPIGRAAATTVMALLQEGSRRFDLNTAELRHALTQQGHQVIELLKTHGLPEPMESGAPELVLDPEDAQKVRDLLNQAQDLSTLVGLKLNVASAAINREVEKQDQLQLFSLLGGYFQQLAQVLPLFANPQVPGEIRMVLSRMIQGADRLLERIFQSHGAFDLGDVLLGDTFAALSQSGMGQGTPGPGGGNGLGEPLPPESAPIGPQTAGP